MNGTRKLFGNVLDMLPYRRRTSIVSPIVMSAIGIGVLGGIAAILIFSPRTRYRVLGVAKETYGKLASSNIGGKLGVSHHDVFEGTSTGTPSNSSSYGVSTGI